MIVASCLNPIPAASSHPLNHFHRRPASPLVPLEMPLANLRIDRKATGQFITVAAVVLIGVMALPLNHEVDAADLSVRPPDSLQQEWNDMMLAGRFGRIDNGQVTKVEPDNSLSDPSTSRPDPGWVKHR
jgi:hypothetical protein